MNKLRTQVQEHGIDQTLRYGDSQIPYRVYFVSRSRNKIKIDLLPCGKVQVLAPHGAGLDRIKTAVSRRARWLYNHLCNIRQRQIHILPREYVSGESHYYLGRRYVLKIIPVKNIEPHVKLARGQLQVRTFSRDPATIRSLLNDWYRHRAEQVFARRIDELTQKINWLKSAPPWKMRLMKKQWGSCSPKGVITLNPLLVKAPGECIEYVLVHEICHIKEHNHSARYYKLLKRTIPHWEEVKTRLDGMSEFLLHE